MIVDIRIGAAALAGTLANMRTRLDRNRCAITRFETQSPEPGVVLIRADFGDGAEAAASAAAFQRAFGKRGTRQRRGGSIARNFPR